MVKSWNRHALGCGDPAIHRVHERIGVGAKMTSENAEGRLRLVVTTDEASETPVYEVWDAAGSILFTVRWDGDDEEGVFQAAGAVQVVFADLLSVLNEIRRRRPQDLQNREEFLRWERRWLPAEPQDTKDPKE